MKLFRFIILLTIIFHFPVNSVYSQINLLSETDNQNTVNRITLVKDSTNNQLLGVQAKKERIPFHSISRARDDKHLKVKGRVSNNISLDGSIIPFFIVLGETFIPIWLTTKFTHPIIDNRLLIGGGIIGGTVIGKSHSVFGLLYGNTIIGSSENNVGLGLGYVTYGFTNAEMEKSPVIILNGMAKTSQNWYFLSDNYFFNTEYGVTGILSLTGRKMAKKIGFDFGIIIPIGGEIEAFMPIPWVGIHIPFRGK